MDAGRLKLRCYFEAYLETSDGGGGGTFQWLDRFDRRGALAFANLGTQLETIQQGELTAQTRATLTIREDSQTRTIESEWRVRIVEGGYRTRTWKIGEIQRPAPGWLRMTVEAG